MGDRDHIKDTQSIIHRFCTNPLKPWTTFEADQDHEHEEAFVEFQLIVYADYTAHIASTAHTAYIDYTV